MTTDTYKNSHLCFKVIFEQMQINVCFHLSEKRSMTDNKLSKCFSVKVIIVSQYKNITKKYLYHKLVQTLSLTITSVYKPIGDNLTHLYLIIFCDLQNSSGRKNWQLTPILGYYKSELLISGIHRVWRVK